MLWGRVPIENEAYRGQLHVAVAWCLSGASGASGVGV